MAANGRAQNTIMRFRAVLGMALTHAERSGPGGAQRRPAGRDAGGCPTADGGQISLTFEEATALLAAAKADRLGALWSSGLMLGLRPGELSGLLWEDVDLDGATIQVRRSLKNERSGLRLGDPKTRRNYRGLDLPPLAADALRTHRVRQLEERMFAGRAWVDNGLVFTTQVGTSLDPANLRRSFSKLTTTARLGHWTPRELCHSATSLLSAAGVPLELIADVLGYDGTRMTGAVYRHAVRPTVSAGAEAMQRIFG